MYVAKGRLPDLVQVTVMEEACAVVAVVVVLEAWIVASKMESASNRDLRKDCRPPLLPQEPFRLPPCLHPAKSQ